MHPVIVPSLDTRTQFIKDITHKHLDNALGFKRDAKADLNKKNYKHVKAALQFARHRGVLPSVSYCCDALAWMNETYTQGINRHTCNFYATQIAHQLIDCVVAQVENGKTFERIYAHILRYQASRFNMPDVKEARVQEEWMNYAQEATVAKVLDNRSRQSDARVSFKEVPAVLPPCVHWNGRSF